MKINFAKATLSASLLASSALLSAPAATIPPVKISRAFCLDDTKLSSVRIFATFQSPIDFNPDTEEGRRTARAIDRAIDQAITIFDEGLDQTIENSIKQPIHDLLSYGLLDISLREPSSGLRQLYASAATTVENNIARDPVVAEQMIETTILLPKVTTGPIAQFDCHTSNKPRLGP